MSPGVVLYDVLTRHTGHLRHILARDERHAGYMADGYARTHRRIGVCEASSGAGAVYLAGGLGEAYAGSVPVLAITSDIHRRSRGSGAITEIDQEALFSGVTKWRAAAERAADIPTLVAEAIAAATTGRPGPVALIVEHAAIPVATTIHGKGAAPEDHVRVPEHKDSPPPVAPWQAVLTGRSNTRPFY
ncbi:thiamine pyrophosphate-binding protein [Nonomuraea polychroma]|uniref:thiamine pyrophosphate-binding protein n=1 Tax=Nonomuraea polychroma TaxID=46176 RepID=UPI0013E3D0A9|nr:thiamine pyrophosphate-binding protein [Nonomuraea polychroma]